MSGFFGGIGRGRNELSGLLDLIIALFVIDFLVGGLGNLFGGLFSK